MNKFLAALVVAALVVLVPAIVTGLFDAANLALWLRLLSRRIKVNREELSVDEIYIPNNVKSGLYPMSLVGVGLILLGIFFFMPLSDVLKSDVLMQVAIVAIAGPPMFALILLGFRAIVDSFKSGQLQSHAQIKADEYERKEKLNEKIKLLSEGIEHRDGNALLSLYRRYWRAAHRLDAITNAWSQPFFDESMVNEINRDLDYVENNMQADKSLLKAVRKEKRRLTKASIKTVVCPNCNETLSFRIPALKDKAAFSKEHKEVCPFCNATLIFKTKSFEIISHETKRVPSKEQKEAITEAETISKDEEIRIPCAQCGAMILPATAERNEGICTPCKKKQIAKS